MLGLFELFISYQFEILDVKYFLNRKVYITGLSGFLMSCRFFLLSIWMRINSTSAGIPGMMTSAMITMLK